MRRRNKTKQTSKETDSGSKQFAEQIKRLSEGLYYISETDAPILPFTGNKAEAVTKDEILRQTQSTAGTAVEERNFAETFARLTQIQDWFGDEEKESAAKFDKLKSFLEQNLKDLKMFKIGTVQIKIYFVGLNADGNLTGIRTEAVET